MPVEPSVRDYSALNVKRRLRQFGHVGITGVITAIGYYTSVSVTLAFYHVPDGAPGMAS
jgi:4-carboxymuconolactone decarboxylase